MTDTPYTPEDLDEAEGDRPDAAAPESKPAERDHARNFDPGSPAADAPATF